MNDMALYTNFAARLRMCRDEFDDDDGTANRWFDSHDWDEVDDDDEFDPEPSDEEVGDEFRSGSNSR